jgi:glycosyltransferase involved in cell wall biosynthesis
MKISVICPVYNARPELLSQAVDSVLEQDGGTACELVLVDDGSTSPQTLEALRQLEQRHPQITVVRPGRNGGPARARNLGLEAASGDWIGFIDADDLWPAGKLEHARAVHRETPDTQWIGGNFADLGPDAQLTPNTHVTAGCKPVSTGAFSKRLASADLTRALISGWLHLGTSFVRKDLIQRAGAFDERVRYGEDWLLFARMSTYAPMDFDPRIGYLLRRQEASMMRSFGRMSSRYAACARLARRDPVFKDFRRELRWYDYGLHKDMAMNNLINHRTLYAALFSLRAFLISPDELKELGLFFKIMLFSRSEDRQKLLKKYSSAEQVNLAGFSA